jgi:hypothetical protein
MTNPPTLGGADCRCKAAAAALARLRNERWSAFDPDHVAGGSPPCS